MDGSTGARIHALTSFEDDGLQLLALEELNQMLSLGQQGEFRVSAYVPALIKVMDRGGGNAQLVLMAVRALTQIIDIEPRAGALAVSEGVLPVLCLRLLSISDLDVAEQCVKCLNILSTHHARDVLHAGGLKAVTAFFDFFPQHLQRKAVETASILCQDAGRQIEDAVNVLEALPGLSLCMESPDERILTNACQCFARLVSCYSSSQGTSSRPGHAQHRHRSVLQPSLESLKALQAFSSASQHKDPTLTYHDINLGPFQPRYSPQWRKQVLALLSTEKIVNHVLTMAKRKSGDESSHLISALARVARSCPHIIITLVENGILEVLKSKLSATGSSRSGEGLTAALRLIQAMLPPVPHSKSFDRAENGELCNREAYDASLILSSEERMAAANRREEMARSVMASTNNSSEFNDVAMGNVDGGGDNDSVWACPMCTYHNPKSATSCEICGQVSFQISERASRLEHHGNDAEDVRHSIGASSNDPGSMLEKLLEPSENCSLGIRSCTQLFREIPEILERFALELMPDLTQVAAKSANPDHRTRALGALASLLYCAPRSLLERVAQSFGAGGRDYVGVVHAGLQSQNPHVVGSTLRVAMIELWRTGIDEGLRREGIPQLIRGLGARFPESGQGMSSNSSLNDVERVQSLRRRAAAWLSYYENLIQEQETIETSGAVDSTLNKLRSISERLLNVHPAPEMDTLSSGLERKVSISPRVPTPASEENETLPKKKRRRMTGAIGVLVTPVKTSKDDFFHAGQGDAEREYISILTELSLLLNQGVVASEFQSSNLAPVMAGLANTRPEFVTALRLVFGDTDACKPLMRTLHDALDGAERFAVIKHGTTTNESFRAIKVQERVVLLPTEHTTMKLAKVLKPFLNMGVADDDSFAFAIKVDPLVRSIEVEQFIWSQIKGKAVELRTVSTSDPGHSTKRSAAAAALGLSSAVMFDSERDEARYAILQAEDPVHVVKYLGPGTRVVRGKDWKWGDQDGGPGRTGVVTDVRSWNGHPDSCIRVRWDTSKTTNVYRYNVENAFDLALAPRMPSRPIPSSGKSSKELIESGILSPVTDSFRQNLKRGDQVDAMDTFHRWYHGSVRVVVPRKDSREGGARISFSGFGPRYDEWIPLSSERLAPLGSRVNPTGFSLGQADDAADLYLRADAQAFNLSPNVVLLGGASPTRKEEESSIAQSSSNVGLFEEDEASNSAIGAIKELPMNSRIKCKGGDDDFASVMVHAGMPVRVRRQSEDSWWEGVVLQLGEKRSNQGLKVNENRELDPDTEGNDMQTTKEVEEEAEMTAESEPEESKTAEEGRVPETLSAGPSAAATASSFPHAVLEARTGGTMFALVKHVQSREDEEDEEDDDDEDSEWLDLSEVFVQPSSAKAPTRTSGDVAPSGGSDGEDSENAASKASADDGPLLPGSQGFAKIGILGREAFISVKIVSESSPDTFEVETCWGEEALETQFHVAKAMVTRTPPRRSYCPSLKDVKAIAKAVREVEDLETREGEEAARTSAIRQTSSAERRTASSLGAAPDRMSSVADELATSAPDDDALLRAEAALTSAAAREGAADVDEDPLDDDGVSRSPVPVVSAASTAITDEQMKKQRRMEKAKLLFASSRTRTLARDYSGVDFTSELTSSSLHHSLSAAAAMATRLAFHGSEADANEDDDASSKPDPVGPVRLRTRREPSDTMHLCLARLASLDECSGTLGGVTYMEYSIDFAHPNVEAMYKALQAGETESGGLGDEDDLEELSGVGTVSSSKVYSVASNFPTLCVRDVKLGEEMTNWYFEVAIVAGGLAQIGFVDAEAACDDAQGKGCGDDLHSWAFDGKRRVTWHGQKKEWGNMWKDGDVLGVAVRIKPDQKCDIFFSLNGSFVAPMGCAFEDVVFSDYLRPALTFNKTFSCRLRLDKFSFAPPDESFQPLIRARKVESGDEEGMSVEDAEKASSSSAQSAIDVGAALSDPEVVAPEPVDESLFSHLFDKAEPLPPAAQVLKLLEELKLSDAEELVNRRLTNKLVWQLQDALAVCSGALPQWCFRAVHEFPFLFPLETRQVLFSSTALGVSRSLYRATIEFEQDTGRTPARSTITGESAASGIQLKRQKVVLPRKRVLESGMKVMRKFARSKSVLTVEFSDEIGHGLGPTLEFYAIVCREFQRKDLGLWRFAGHVVTSATLNKVETVDDAEDASVVYVHAAQGLFPAVLPDSVPSSTKSRVLDLFRYLGRLIGRSLLDERLLDLDLSELFLEKVIGSESREDSNDLDTEELLEQMQIVDPDFAQNMRQIYAFGVEYHSLLDKLDEAAVSRRDELAQTIDALELEFVLPGADDVRVAEMLDGRQVTAANSLEYVRAVCSVFCVSGIRAQVEACREGLAQTVAPEHLRAFTTSELRAMLGGASDDVRWSEQEIAGNLILRDYTPDSAPIVQLLQILCEFDKDERRLFLRFLTGMPRLPVGGWAALRPKMSVVRKSVESGDALPSCSTCAVMLKLPQYPSKAVLREKLVMAIREGQSFFSMD